MLILNPKPYRGRYHATAVSTVKSGKKVGFAWIGPDPEEKWGCHKCGAQNEKPVFTAEVKDAWVECPGCKVPFVLASYELAK